MRLFAFVFTLLFSVNIFANEAVQGSDTLRLNLNEALTIALSENLTVKIAEKEINKTGFAKKGTYSSLYPQINFSGSYQRTLEKQTMYMGENSFKVGLDNSWSTGFDLSIPIVSVPLWKSLKISAMDVELAIEKARGSKIDLVDQVQQTYFSIHGSSRIKKLASLNINFASDTRPFSPPLKSLICLNTSSFVKRKAANVFRICVFVN